MAVARRGIQGGPVLLLIGIAPFLICRFIVTTAPAWLVGAVAVCQAAAFVWLAAVHPASKRLAPRYRAPLAVAAIAVVATAILWPGLPTRSVSLVVGGICHAAAYTCLLIWFAASSRPNREPVVTGFARKLRQTMPPTVVRYTRLVTIAWSIFFAAQLAVSAALLLAAPTRVWSAFVNLWNLPLVVAMILAEFGCRWFLFRHEPHTGLLATLAGIRRLAR
jgi:uncharacterized membrane protein